MDSNPNNRENELYDNTDIENGVENNTSDIVITIPVDNERLLRIIDGLGSLRYSP